MTVAELATLVIPGLIGGGLYLYILNERRKLLAARADHVHPAE